MKKKIKKLTLMLNNQMPNWVSVICPELMVSGFGKTIEEAKEACMRAIRVNNKLRTCDPSGKGIICKIIGASHRQFNSDRVLK